MTTGNVVEITDSNFESEVLKSEKLTLVDFWAPWCGPCKIIGPIMEELSNDYEGKVKFTKLNVDDNPNTATTYGIRGIPTVIFYKNGEVVDQVIGAVPKSELEKVISKGL
jgi:thioredoxin 1